MSRNGTAHAGQRARRSLSWSTVAIGIGGAMGGVVTGFWVGLIVGGNIGSDWIPWVEDQEYLEAAPVLAVVGGVVFGVLAFWLASRRRSVK